MEVLKLIIEASIKTQSEFVEYLELYKAKGQSKEYYLNLGKLEQSKIILDIINQLENETK